MGPHRPPPSMVRADRRHPRRERAAPSCSGSYGPPDVLELGSIPTPAPGPGEVLVRVRAASVNARDWHVMRGEPRIARLLDRGSFGLRGPRVAIRGTDLAGTVEAVGEGVTRWRVGDHVFGEGTATLADHAVVPADQLASIPAGLGFDEAAALPLAATTALLCLDAADPAPGDSVLVNGASGGVGTFAVQLAKALGLHVTAVVSPRNAALAGSLGADGSSTTARRTSPAAASSTTSWSTSSGTAACETSAGRSDPAVPWCSPAVEPPVRDGWSARSGCWPGARCTDASAGCAS